MTKDKAAAALHGSCKRSLLVSVHIHILLLLLLLLLFGDVSQKFHQHRRQHWQGPPPQRFVTHETGPLAVSERFQSGFRAVFEQFQAQFGDLRGSYSIGSFIVASEQFQSNFRVILEQFCDLGGRIPLALSEQF